MKKILLTLIAAVGLAFVASPANAILDGSAHDFIDGGFAATGFAGSLCESCHVPHKPLQNVPLWAHALSVKTHDTYGAAADYSGSAAQLAAYDDGATAVTFSGATAACLSCHDGTLASAVGYTMDETSIGWIMWDTDNGGLQLPASTTGLVGSHPVAVNYTVIQGLDTAGYVDLITTPDPDVKLEGGTHVGCSSCHDAHNKQAKMLVKANNNSQICTSCHIK